MCFLRLGWKDSWQIWKWFNGRKLIFCEITIFFYIIFHYYIYFVTVVLIILRCDGYRPISFGDDCRLLPVAIIFFMGWLEIIRVTMVTLILTTKSSYVWKMRSGEISRTYILFLAFWGRSNIYGHYLRDRILPSPIIVVSHRSLQCMLNSKKMICFSKGVDVCDLRS